MEKGEQSVYRIARQQNVTPRHVRRIYKRYRDVPKTMVDQIRIQRCGRKPKIMTNEEVMQIVEVKTEYPDMGAVSLEKILRGRGVLLSHNRIHRYLRSKGLANIEPKKGKRRKWVRYERKHSNSLWHTDWHETALGQFIAFIDDRSRFIVSYGLFKNATTDNSIKVYYDGVKNYGIPKQLISDHGTQFCKDPDHNYKFRKEVEKNGTQHILARVKHPQSNGKMERFFYTFEKLLRYFRNIDDAIAYYNFKRPHTSLEKDGRLVTPYEAFVEQRRTERFLNEEVQTIMSRGH